jgi:hypothetical protein
LVLMINVIHQALLLPLGSKYFGEEFTAGPKYRWWSTTSRKVQSMHCVSTSRLLVDVSTVEAR